MSWMGFELVCQKALDLFVARGSMRVHHTEDLGTTDNSDETGLANLCSQKNV